jgi:hypothetical protein
MDDVEAILRLPCERESSLVRTLISYEDGAPGAVLTEDPLTRRLWRTALQIAAVFGTTVRNVDLHLEAIYAEDLLQSIRTKKSHFVVRIENGRRVHREVVFYDFEAISAVGNRVSTLKGAAFRRWRARLVEAHLTGLVGIEAEVLVLREANRALEERLAAGDGDIVYNAQCPEDVETIELAISTIVENENPVLAPDGPNPFLPRNETRPRGTLTRA